MPNEYTQKQIDEDRGRIESVIDKLMAAWNGFIAKYADYPKKSKDIFASMTRFKEGLEGIRKYNKETATTGSRAASNLEETFGRLGWDYLSHFFNMTAHQYEPEFVYDPEVELLWREIQALMKELGGIVPAYYRLITGIQVR